jgi:hypothetical protein
MVKVKPCAKVITIEPARNAFNDCVGCRVFQRGVRADLRVEEFDKLVLNNLTKS